MFSRNVSLKRSLPRAFPITHPITNPFPSGVFKSLRLLLLRLCRFGGFLAIAPHHHDAEETPHDGAAEQQKDYGDADGPDAGREEGLDWVGVVDEGLVVIAFSVLFRARSGGFRLTIKSVQIV